MDLMTWLLLNPTWISFCWYAASLAIRNRLCVPLVHGAIKHFGLDRGAIPFAALLLQMCVAFFVSPLMIDFAHGLLRRGNFQIVQPIPPVQATIRSSLHHRAWIADSYLRAHLPVGIAAVFTAHARKLDPLATGDLVVLYALAQFVAYACHIINLPWVRSFTHHISLFAILVLFAQAIAPYNADFILARMDLDWHPSFVRYWVDRIFWSF